MATGTSDVGHAYTLRAALIVRSCDSQPGVLVPQFEFA